MPKVLLVGGGTLGSVTPLLAVAEASRAAGQPHQFQLWGSAAGPERAAAEAAGVEFSTLTSGKLRRYWSARNLLAPAQTAVGVGQALRAMRRWRPDVVLTAGSFVAVPAAAAARLLGVPVVAHQQDIRIGLANWIIAPLARLVTVVFERHVRLLGRVAIASRKPRVVCTGNPVRADFREPASASDVESTRTRFGAPPGVPLVLVIGGSTGALRLNELVVAAVTHLAASCHVVHITGAGKDVLVGQHGGYTPLTFISDSHQMAQLLQAADLVVCRAGMGTLSELSATGSAALLLPLPGTHQELNAAELGRQGAARVVDQQTLSPETFAQMVVELLADRAALGSMRERIGTVLKTTGGGEYLELVLARLGLTA